MAWTSEYPNMNAFRKTGIVLISDEVQSDFARTGKMFALEHVGVSPHLITMNKSMAGGTTLSAIVVNEKLLDRANALGVRLTVRLKKLPSTTRPFLMHGDRAP